MGLLFYRKVARDRRVHLPKKIFQHFGAGFYSFSVRKLDNVYFRLYSKYPLIGSFSRMIPRDKLKKTYTSIPIFLPNEKTYRNLVGKEIIISVDAVIKKNKVQFLGAGGNEDNRGN